ncbi:MAG TPA: transcription termination/antitermination NusG family protein [Pirellulales bacterium]|nr:transcription termination/antitermination NusG family protein [Pirellulales bacterium]
MPILDAEIQCYPANLLESDDAAGQDRQWWVVRTRTRQEKSLARDLLQREIPFYLPQIHKTSVVRGRRRTSFLPLFSGYLFMFGDEQERYHSMTTNRVAQVLPVTDQRELLEDLSQIFRLIEAKAPLTIEGRLKAGDQVRVKNGSFAGVEGTVLARGRRTRVVVAVRLIQQGVSLEVDDFQLELL